MGLGGNGNWEVASSGYLSSTSSSYIHSDHHGYVFNHDNPKLCFATSGGISKVLMVESL